MRLGVWIRATSASVVYANCAWDAFWGDRLAPDWEPRSREQAQAILDGLGLTEPFWQLG